MTCRIMAYGFNMRNKHAKRPSMAASSRPATSVAHICKVCIDGLKFFIFRVFQQQAPNFCLLRLIGRQIGHWL